MPIRDWSRSEKLTLLTALIAFASCVTAVSLPEVRKLIGLQAKDASAKSEQPRPASELIIKQREYRGSLLVVEPGKISKDYDITIPKGDWYNTSIWIRSDYSLYVRNEYDSPQQPFMVKIGSTELLPKMDSSGKFVLSIDTVSNPEKANTRNIYLPQPQQILLRVSDEAQSEELTLALGTVIYEKVDGLKNPATKSLR